MQETGGMESYSTDEQVIGTWVDGKKIYRKVLEVNRYVPATGYTTDISALKVKQVINVSGFTTTHVLPFSNPWSHFYFDMNSTNTIVSFCPYSGTSGTAVSSVTYWIEYTKTTD